MTLRSPGDERRPRASSCPAGRSVRLLPAQGSLTETLRLPRETSLAASISRRIGATSRLAKPMPSQIADSNTTTVTPRKRMAKAICVPKRVASSVRYSATLSLVIAR